MQQSLLPSSLPGRPNCCPDEEGIKTINVSVITIPCPDMVRIAALMKKGLRLYGQVSDVNDVVHVSELLP